MRTDILGPLLIIAGVVAIYAGAVALIEWWSSRKGDP